MRKAFRPIERIDGTTVFMSKELRMVLREGMAAAENHEFMILDTLPGAGVTTALEALKQLVRNDAKKILVEVVPDEILTTHSLWSILLKALGEKPAWRWEQRIDQFQDKLYELAQEDKTVLVVVDDAIILRRCHWTTLKHLSSLHYKGTRYGPGVILVANLDCKAICYKPKDVIDAADTLSLQGLLPAEIKRYIEFQAERDGVRFSEGFKAEVLKRLDNPYLTENGLHTLPGIINKAARNVERIRFRTGEKVTDGPAARKPAKEKVGVPG